MKSGDVKYGKAKATWGHKGNKRLRKKEFVSNAPTRDYSKVILGIIILIVTTAIAMLLW